MISGFESWAVVAEYRALRASVLRLWRESDPVPDLRDLDDVTRFNESLDQSLTHGVRSYAEQVERDREALMGPMRISDLGMPDRDGLDLIRQLRNEGHDAKDLPAVALTAFVQKDDAHLALLAGLQVHLPKPVDPHDLTSAIARLVPNTS